MVGRPAVFSLSHLTFTLHLDRRTSHSKPQIKTSKCRILWQKIKSKYEEDLYPLSSSSSYLYSMHSKNRRETSLNLTLNTSWLQQKWKSRRDFIHFLSAKFHSIRDIFQFGIKFSWNEEIDTCFNVECVLLDRNFDFCDGSLVVTSRYLVVTACYLVVTGGYCSLPLVTASSHFQYERFKYS